MLRKAFRQLDELRVCRDARLGALSSWQPPSPLSLVKLLLIILPFLGVDLELSEEGIGWTCIPQRLMRRMDRSASAMGAHRSVWQRDLRD